MASKALTQLPNLLLSTTYALNKSNTKRAIIGLTYHGGLYRPVVKLSGGGPPSKYVTLSVADWEALVDQMSTMDEYLRHSYVSTYAEYGIPQKIFLPQHDINFTTAYGARAIAIDERPVIEKPNVTDGGNSSKTISEDSTQQTTQVDGPIPKKKKFENPPGVILQYATFDGLRDVRECIAERLKWLENNSAFVNRLYDTVINFVKEKITAESDLDSKGLLKECYAFRNYYLRIRGEIEAHVLNESQMFFANENCIELVLHELYAFYLPTIATDVFNIMYE